MAKEFINPKSKYKYHKQNIPVEKIKADGRILSFFIKTPIIKYIKKLDLNQE